MNLIEPKFSIGKIYATAGVAAWAEDHRIDLTRYLRLHHCGEWGELEEEDKQANEDALKFGARILSAYRVGERKIWVITEADRSHTTMLFPSEY